MKSLDRWSIIFSSEISFFPVYGSFHFQASFYCTRRRKQAWEWNEPHTGKKEISELNMIDTPAVQRFNVCSHPCSLEMEAPHLPITSNTPAVPPSSTLPSTAYLTLPSPPGRTSSPAGPSAQPKGMWPSCSRHPPQIAIAPHITRPSRTTIK